MKTKLLYPCTLLCCIALFLFQCEEEKLLTPEDNSVDAALSVKGGGGKPSGETAGNNLSFPVIWAEGVQKTLPGTPGMIPNLGGEWWYQWGTNGTDPDIVPASCPPDPDNLNYCDDGVAGTFDESLVPGVPAADNPLPLSKAFLQKDQYNSWQAGSADWSAAPVNVDWIDWGDNLESVDWYTRSQVRTEVVLFQDLPTPMTEYEMRHTSGWGINEVHGLAGSVADNEPIMGPGTQATVYSPCARFTIQKLKVDKDDPALAGLIWTPGVGWVNPEGENLINAPIFNMAVHEAQDGPGYYNAEINVKGRIIYGYTWNVRKLNEGAGCYRLTFSFDAWAGLDELNTFFTDGITEIMYPAEEELLVAASEEGEEPGGGGTAVLDYEHNLTYMDIRILERTGGGGGGSKGGGGGTGGGGGNGGGNPN